MKQWHIFLAFFKVGMLGYGGGPSSIPLVKKEVVENYKWLDDEEFANILAIGNTLPGPIATKMAGYIGYRVSGLIGMMNAVLATIIPTIIIMILLLTFLVSLSDKPWVQGMTQAVIPVVAVMLAVLTYDFLKKAETGLGWMMTIGLVAVSALLIEGLGLHPGILIALLLIYALIKPNKDEDEISTKEKVRGEDNP